jgi:hypothetical protein
VVTAAQAEGDCREFFEWSRLRRHGNLLKPRPGLTFRPIAWPSPLSRLSAIAPITFGDCGLDSGTLRPCIAPESSPPYTESPGNGAPLVDHQEELMPRHTQVQGTRRRPCDERVYGTDLDRIRVELGRAFSRIRRERKQLSRAQHLADFNAGRKQRPTAGLTAGFGVGG